MWSALSPIAGAVDGHGGAFADASRDDIHPVQTVNSITCNSRAVRTSFPFGPSCRPQWPTRSWAPLWSLSLGMIVVSRDITRLSDDHLAAEDSEEVLDNDCGGAVEELAGQNKRVTTCTAKFSGVRGLSAVVAVARLPA